MTDPMDTEALMALMARGRIAPDKAINQGTLDAAAAAPALAAEVLELRIRLGFALPVDGEQIGNSVSDTSILSYDLTPEEIGIEIDMAECRAFSAGYDAALGAAPSGDLISREAAIAAARDRHIHWAALGGACLVDDDISACADIAEAIRAIPAQGQPIAPAVKVKPLLDLADKIEAEERDATTWGGPDPRGASAQRYAMLFVKRLRDEARILSALGTP